MSATVGAILLSVLTLYAALGGADFGGGFWDLTAGGAARGRRPRQFIDDTITPVWEANHVWLIFALVITWTGFPTAFAAVMTAAAVPLWLAVLGIVLRGAGFAFRKEVQALHWQRLLGATFAVSSLLTPFFKGAVGGCIVARKVSATAPAATLATWVDPMSLLLGALFVAMCAYLAAVYLIGEADRVGASDLRLYFRRRALAAGLAAGALSIAALAELRGADWILFHHLLGRALPLVLLAAGTGVATLALLSTGRTRGLRVLAVLGVSAVIWGWGVAQYPTLLPGTALSLSTASAPRATLVALIGTFAAAAPPRRTLVPAALPPARPGACCGPEEHSSRGTRVGRTTWLAPSNAAAERQREQAAMRPSRDPLRCAGIVASRAHPVRAKGLRPTCEEASTDRWTDVAFRPGVRTRRRRKELTCPSTRLCRADQTSGITETRRSGVGAAASPPRSRVPSSRSHASTASAPGRG